VVDDPAQVSNASSWSAYLPGCSILSGMLHGRPSRLSDDYDSSFFEWDE
jgi:hypothetical protein